MQLLGTRLSHSMRNLFIHECAASATHRRALRPGLPAFPSPLPLTWGTNPRMTMTYSAGSPVYPLSRHRCCGRSKMSGRSTSIRHSRISNWGTSCRFAPVATIDSGTPLPSTRRWRLLPFFSPVGGVVPDRLEGKRSLGHAAVHTQPVPLDAAYLVVAFQSGDPQALEEPLFAPVPEVAARRTPWEGPSTACPCA